MVIPPTVAAVLIEQASGLLVRLLVSSGKGTEADEVAEILGRSDDRLKRVLAKAKAATSD